MVVVHDFQWRFWTISPTHISCFSYSGLSPSTGLLKNLKCSQPSLKACRHWAVFSTLVHLETSCPDMCLQAPGLGSRQAGARMAGGRVLNDLSAQGGLLRLVSTGLPCPACSLCPSHPWAWGPGGFPERDVSHSCPLRSPCLPLKALSSCCPVLGHCPQAVMWSRW